MRPIRPCCRDRAGACGGHCGPRRRETVSLRQLKKDIDSLCVISKNLYRRHLTVSQRAAIAAELVPVIAEESKQRQIAHLVQNQKDAPCRPIGPHGVGWSTSIASKALGVGATSVKRVVRARLDLAIRCGRMDLAERIAQELAAVTAALQVAKRCSNRRRSWSLRSFQTQAQDSERTSARLWRCHSLRISKSFDLLRAREVGPCRSGHHNRHNGPVPKSYPVPLAKSQH